MANYRKGKVASITRQIWFFVWRHLGEFFLSTLKITANFQGFLFVFKINKSFSIDKLLTNRTRSSKTSVGRKENG